MTRNEAYRLIRRFLTETEGGEGASLVWERGSRVDVDETDRLINNFIDTLEVIIP